MRTIYNVMKTNPIFVFLVLAPMLLQLFTSEPVEERACDRAPDVSTEETKPAPPPKPAVKKAGRDAPSASERSPGGSTEPVRPKRLPAQDAVTFM